MRVFASAVPTHARRTGASSATQSTAPKAMTFRQNVIALQRTVGNQATIAVLRSPVIQRHLGFRIKRPLETDLLNTPELNTANSSADLALEAGKSNGDAVSRFQQALTEAGHPVAVTGAYDGATQRAVASFQSEHGIPFPTGRQAGPKTLSTLDDHLLGKAPPKPPTPKKDCKIYEAGEREASQKSSGKFTRSGAFSQELRLFDFAAGKNRMKPEHEAELKRFISEFELFDPEAAFEVEFVRGFTDSVDSEDLNAVLRESRAFDVEFVMNQSGVTSVHPQAAADGSYDAGCDPVGRRFARAVFIRLKKKPKPPKKPDPVPPRPDTPKEACGKAFSHWSLQGVIQGGPPLKPGPAGSAIIFMLRAKDDSGVTQATKMIAFTGAGGGASAGLPVTIPLPSQTDFETLPPKRTFDDFDGGGFVMDGGVSLGLGFSLMMGVVHPRTNPDKLDLGGFQLGFGIGFEIIGGEWTTAGGCF